MFFPRFEYETYLSRCFNVCVFESQGPFLTGRPPRIPRGCRQFARVRPAKIRPIRAIRVEFLVSELSLWSQHRLRPRRFKIAHRVGVSVQFGRSHARTHIELATSEFIYGL